MPAILNLLFPAFCANCGKEGKYICQKCYVFAGEAALICPNCKESSFDGKAHKKCYGLNGLASCWEYEGVVKKLLGQIKYGGITHAIQELVRSSFQMMVADQARFGAFLGFLLGGFTITYVPMFLKKEKKRGFNQAEGIAKEIGNFIGARVAPMLIKTKDTPSQTELSKEKRVENVKGSFELRKRVSEIFSPYSSPPAGGDSPRPNPKISGNSFSSLPERVLLVDDIWTTGATMRECAKVLKKAGAKEVWGFTIARTP